MLERTTQLELVNSNVTVSFTSSKVIVEPPASEVGVITESPPSVIKVIILIWPLLPSGRPPAWAPLVVSICVIDVVTFTSPVVAVIDCGVPSKPIHVGMLWNTSLTLIFLFTGLPEGSSITWSKSSPANPVPKSDSAVIFLSAIFFFSL